MKPSRRHRAVRELQRKLPMPHERDEAIGQVATKPDPVIVQAHKDLQSGQVDTDLHGQPGLDAARREQLLRKH